MADSERGQVSASAARIYEDCYLPALFAEWSPRVIESAEIESGQRAVDVACGTGALTRMLAERIGSQGSVVGVDINEGMLGVARGKAPWIDWRLAPAEALPLDDGSFDSAVCQFGLMYFEDRRCALQEMMRVLRPGGSLAVVVWDELDNIPGLAAEDQLWQQLFGEEAADEAPYSLGDKQVLQQLFTCAGIAGSEIRTHAGTARFPSIDAWIYAGAKGWTQDDAIDNQQLELLLKEAQQKLAGFVTAEGEVAFATSAHIVTASKP